VERRFRELTDKALRRRVLAASAGHFDADGFGGGSVKPARKSKPVNTLFFEGFTNTGTFYSVDTTHGQG